MTLGIHDFGLFLASAVVLNLTPGQDTLYILGRALGEGRRSGVAAALGVSAGTAIHSLAAALGVSAIVATSPVAFTALKLVGAAYLFYLGIGLLRSSARPQIVPGVETTPNAFAAFRQGVLTNVANPKVAIFFLAFLPQFVDPTSPHRLYALLLLGLTFVTTSTLWCLVLAIGAARIRGLLQPDTRAAALLPRAAGLLFVALGVRLAFAER